MIVQVLSIDGVGISPAAGMSPNAMAQIIGNKVSPLPCPGVTAASGSKSGVQPLWTTALIFTRPRGTNSMIFSSDFVRRSEPPYHMLYHYVVAV
jgi:hypothetical protein